MNFTNAETIIELSQSYKIISTLDELYPDFRSWYWNKVVPGVVNGSDKVIMAHNEGNLVGISIIKKGKENKLRALRVLPKYQSKGYGLHLIDESLKQLECSKPLVTVNQDMINDFSRIFINRYNFDMTYVHKDIYIKHKLEYQFNGNKQSLLQTSLPF